MEGNARELAGSDREGIEITDASWREADDGEGSLARVAVVASRFASWLSGLEVVVDRLDQRGPLEAERGAMIASMTQSEAKVATEPHSGKARPRPRL